MQDGKLSWYLRRWEQQAVNTSINLGNAKFKDNGNNAYILRLFFFPYSKTSAIFHKILTLCELDNSGNSFLNQNSQVRSISE